MGSNNKYVIGEERNYMAIASVEVCLIVPGPNGEVKNTLHGRIENDGRIHHTTLGRGPQDVVIDDFSHVAEIHEKPNTPLTENRYILLGEDIIYVYDERVQFVNYAGIIFTGPVGIEPGEGWKPVDRNIYVGDSIPTTIFQTSDRPAFQIINGLSTTG